MDDKNMLDSEEYPQKWSEYIGQAPAKAMLQVAAHSARIRKEPLDHVLITHPTSGVGKTALAVLISKEMRTDVRVVSGQINRDKARMILSDMKDRDVLFLDEAHTMFRGSEKSWAWLLHYLQDSMIPTPFGMEAYPKVTWVMATTESTAIPEAIHSRLTLVPPMEDYSTEEAAKIAVIQAKKVLSGMPSLRMSDAILLATAAHNNPRGIRQLLRVLRDMVVTDTLPVQKGGRYDIPGLLAFQGISHDGLDRVAQQYLRVLAEEFAGSAGAKALEDRLQQPGGLGQTERLLLDKGYLARTTRGRVLTLAGIRRSRELAS